MSTTQARRYHIHATADGTWVGVKEDTGRISVRAATFAEAQRRTQEAAARWNAEVIVDAQAGKNEQGHCG